MKINFIKLTLPLIIIATVFFFQIESNNSLGVTEDGNSNSTQQSNFGEEDVFTPIVLSVLAPPVPVKGSDGLYHIVYELFLTNSNRFEWEVLSVDVLDGDLNGRVLHTVSGEEVENKMRFVGTRQPTDSLEPAQSGLIFIAFSVEGKENIPDSLLHRLTITSPGGLPEQIVSILALPKGQDKLVEFGAPVKIGSNSAVVLGPPLRGPGWVAANGCCDSVTHMRSDLPMNGKIYISQRFAIDWMKANKDNRLYVGDPQNLKSWFGYDQDVLAVADARVVTVVDEYQDQTPFILPTDVDGITIQAIDGNHIVLELENGQYVFYAHLKQWSTKVKEGDLVKRGDVIAKLGNTGNTSAPHLHLHVMETPLTIGSNGLPYTFKEYNLMGRTTEESFFDQGLEDNTPFIDEKTGLIKGNSIDVLPVNMPGPHSGDLPLDLRIVEFP